MKKLLIMTCAAGMMSLGCFATTYYLKPDGDDSAAGTSESAAFKTVNKAFSVVHNQGSKDELIILPGEYAATGTLSMAGQYGLSDTANADVIRSSTRNPADVVIYGYGTFNLLNLAQGVVVEGITFSNGVATAAGIAGGVRVGSNTPDSPTLLTNCVITCCGATCAAKAAGGVYVHGGGIVADCVIENCTATTDGGAAGVFLNNSSKTPTIDHSIIRNCSGENYTNDKTCAGGVASAGTKDGSERIVDCVISNCTTTAKGGGAYFEFGHSALVTGTTFALCHAIRGGGVLAMDGTGAFENCSFTGNNSNAGDNGGGMLLSSTACVSLNNCSFSGNVAGKGGAVYFTSNSRVSLAGCDFSSNNADDGGAFYMAGQAVVSLANCTFTSNRAGYGGAAGFEQGEGSYFAFTNSVFASNFSTKYGGAVSCCRSNYPPNGKDGTGDDLKGMYGEFYGCTFTNNVAQDAGGAFFLRENNSSRNSGTPLILRNSLFAYNRVSTSGSYHCGGGIYLLSYDNPVVDSCTIASNDVTSAGVNQFGAGFYNRWKCSIINTIIACNSMNEVLEGANDWIRGSSTVTASHSCAYPAPAPASGSNPFTAAKGCISADPKFVDAAHGDCRLQPNSPCVNAGLDENWMTSNEIDPVTHKRVKVLDLAGVPRLYGENVDMGCYEVWFPKGTVISFQ